MESLSCYKFKGTLQTFIELSPDECFNQIVDKNFLVDKKFSRYEFVSYVEASLTLHRGFCVATLS